jgi:hypothetical protein
MSDQVLAAQDRAQSSENTAPQAERLTIDTVVEAWVSAERKLTSNLLRLGQLAGRWLRAELAALADAGDRRRRRAELIAQLKTQLRSAGIRGDMLDVNRCVLTNWAAQRLGPREAAAMPWGVVRQFAGFICRQRDSENYILRDSTSEKAKALWARAVAEQLTAGQVAAALGKKHAKKATRPFSPRCIIGRLGSAKEVWESIGREAPRQAIIALITGAVAAGHAGLISEIAGLLQEQNARAA